MRGSYAEAWKKSDSEAKQMNRRKRWHCGIDKCVSKTD